MESLRSPIADPRAGARRLAVPGVALDDGVVRLRVFDEADVEQITVACQDETLQRFIPIPYPYEPIDAERYVARTKRQWASGEKAAFAVVGPEDPTVLLGAVNLAVPGSTGTAAYWVVSSVRGLGVASRALRLLSNWAFDVLGLGVILLEIDPANEASKAVARSVGYHECGKLALGTGTRADTVTHLLYARLAADPHT